MLVERQIKRELQLEDLLLIMSGHNAFQLVFAGIELKLFDTLSESPGLTLHEIANALSLKIYPCRVLLIGLAALGIVQKDGERYFNSELCNRHLVGSRTDSFAPIIGWQAHIVYPALVDFVDSIRQSTNVGLRHFPGKGQTLYERLQSHPNLEKIFQDAMSGISKNANHALVEAYNFGEFTHIVDAGGGDATNAIALAKRYPLLKLTVYDSPSVLEIAKKNIAQAGLEKRVFTHTGNFLVDPFPEDIDAILFCHIMTIWSMERNATLLKKCHQALPAKGATIIFNMFGNDDDTGPLSTALGSPYFLTIATGEGMLHSWKDYESALNSVGFSKIVRVDGLPVSHGLIVGFK